MGVEIRRGSERFAERGTGRATWHSFSFGAAYDPGNLGFGPIVCHDDHWLARGQGFETHRHRDLVVVSWVVSGALAHTGPDGEHVVEPGQVAVLRTGAGVEHAEVAAAAQTRFVQVWLTPDSPGGETSYEVLDAVDPAATSSPLTEAVRATSTARLLVARLEAGESVQLPDEPLQHVFVARGALTRSSLAEPLADGDAFRITDVPGATLTAAVPTELLVWAMTEPPRG